jgi:hypothetical protein
MKVLEAATLATLLPSAFAFAPYQSTTKFTVASSLEMSGSTKTSVGPEIEVITQPSKEFLEGKGTRESLMIIA